MARLSRRQFLIVSGIVAAATTLPSVSSCSSRDGLPTFSLSDASLPSDLKAEIERHNAARRDKETSSLKTQAMEDLAVSKSVWHGKLLVSYAQFR